MGYNFQYIDNPILHFHILVPRMIERRILILNIKKKEIYFAPVHVFPKQSYGVVAT